MAAMANSLAQRRRERGLSQRELADAGGLSRQALSALESGRSVPSTLIALRLSRALGCTVEELFWLEEDELLDVALPADRALRGRARIGHVGGRWIAHPIDAGALADVADGEVVELEGTLGRARLFEEQTALKERVWIAGCDPAMGLLAAAAEREGIPVGWISATSKRALGSLDRDEVHVGGAHLYDAQSGEHNVPFVRSLVPHRRCAVIELARADEGLVVAKDNPRAIRAIEDLAQPGVRFVNRPEGAAARDLLDRELASAGVPKSAVRDYDRALASPEAVARAIAEGSADAGIATRAVAIAQGLSFVPLHGSRFDLVVPADLLELASIERLLAFLSSARFRRRLAALGGYETDGTGRVVGTT